MIEMIKPRSYYKNTGQTASITAKEVLLILKIL